MYGFTTETQNDTELLNKTIEARLDPLDIWENSSLAVIELRSDKSLNVYRNGKRPLYKTTMENGYIVTSTEDIANRAGLPHNCAMLDNAGTTAELQPCYY
jgi:hypothetical protein